MARVSAGDGRHDVAGLDLLAVDVVAAVGEQGAGLAARVPDAAADRRDGVQQR